MGVGQKANGKYRMKRIITLRVGLFLQAVEANAGELDK
jgi:hypothetical protein